MQNLTTDTVRYQTAQCGTRIDFRVRRTRKYWTPMCDKNSPVESMCFEIGGQKTGLLAGLNLESPI